MNIDDKLLLKSEILNFELRKLFTSYGYNAYSMSKFEEYDLYAKNKDFLVSDNVITFTDTDGKLMALKPDVTLSIIKNSKETNTIQKVFYSENVYRISKASDQFKEIMQTGVECFGPISNNEVFNVLTLAAETLSVLCEDTILAVSNIDILSKIIASITDDTTKQTELFKAISEKNINQIKLLSEGSEYTKLLTKLVSVYGPVKTVKDSVKDLLCDYSNEFDSFFEMLDKLSEDRYSSNIYVDFTVLDDVNYYNGIVFKGYVKNHPNSVLSGGQYDKLMTKLHKSSKAIGFAVYIDELERVDVSSQNDDGYINIALPKGRLGEKVYAMFDKAGFDCPAILEQNRKLIFENTEKKIRYFWVKPSDVAIYVERGTADIGVCGKDILAEYEPDIFELLDLKVGKCRMAVAGKKDFKYDTTKTLIVATKFSNVAKEYYKSLGMNIDIIHLNGSIEIAPILGLSDVIVDIVETGTTLRENNLEVVEEIFPISARLIANKASYKYKNEQINKLQSKLFEETKND